MLVEAILTKFPISTEHGYFRALLFWLADMRRFWWAKREEKRLFKSQL